MSDDVFTEGDALAIIPAVPLVTVGSWHASTGPFEATLERCLDMVAALADPGVTRPRVWAGHRTDEDRTGEPALGIIPNLWYDPDDLTVYGDVLTLRAIAEAAPVLFPYRSGEFWHPYRSHVTGREYAMVMDGLALLGVEQPAVRSLADLTRLATGDLTVLNIDIDAADAALAERTAASTTDIADPSSRRIVAAGSWVGTNRKGSRMPRTSAQLEMDAVWTAFYAQHEDEHPWWWIRSVLVDPLAVIVDTDSDMGLVRMTVTVSGDDITFGEAEPVTVQYAPKGSGGGEQTAASNGQGSWRVAANFHTASATRPSTTTGDSDMDVKALRVALGDSIAEDATDEDVIAAAASALAAGGDPDNGDGDGGDDDTPEGDEGGDEGEGDDAPGTKAASLTVTVDADRFARTEADAKAGREAAKVLAAQHRESVLDKHQHRGAITKASRAEWAKAHERDPKGTERLLETLAAGSAAPVDGERGSGVDPGADGDGGVTHEQIRAAAWPQVAAKLAPTSTTKGA